MKYTPNCSHCGKRKKIDPNSDLPAMLGFETEDGNIIYVCSDCLIELGKMSKEEKDKFFERISEEDE